MDLACENGVMESIPFHKGGCSLHTFLVDAFLQRDRCSLGCPPLLLGWDRRVSGTGVSLILEK